MRSAIDLHRALEAAGIPIEGCVSTGLVNFKPEATPEQRAQAKQIVEAFDWNAPVPKVLTVEERLAVLEAEIAKLKAGR